MATSGKTLDRRTQQDIARLRERMSLRETAKELRISTRTVQKYARRVIVS